MVLMDDGAAVLGMGSKWPGHHMWLHVLTGTSTLRVPQVHHVGPMPNGRGSFIVMEALNMSGSCNQAELGRQLALMHLAEPLVGPVDF
jgi:fructosamine-3-kinase